MRMDYHRWCGFWVDRGAWERRVIDADRKRKRKAAKRRRDADRTKDGRLFARYDMRARCADTSCPWRLSTILASDWRYAVWLFGIYRRWNRQEHERRRAGSRRAIRRGEVQQ